MPHRSRLLLGALTAALVLAAAVGTASATRLEVSNTGLRIVFAEIGYQSEGGVEINCPLTLEGTFHSRTISKVSGQLIGFITRAKFDEPACRNFTARILSASLPWHIRYTSFTGSLPNISSVSLQIINYSWAYETVGGPCLYKSTAAQPAVWRLTREAGGVITAVEASGSTPRFEGGILCGATITLVGRGSLMVLGTTTSIRLTLVR